MSIVKMDRLTVVGLQQDREAVIEALMRLGAVEIEKSVQEDATQNAEPARDADAIELAKRPGDTDRSDALPTQQLLTRLESVLPELQRLDTEKKPMFSQKRMVSADDFMAIAQREQELYQLIVALEKDQEKAAQLRSDLNRLRTRVELLQPWQEVDIDLADPNIRSVTLFWGSFDTREAFAEFTEAMEAEAPETGIEVIAEDEGGLLCIVYTWQPRESLVRNHLRSFGFDLLPLQGQKGTPRDVLRETQEKLKACESQLAKIKARQMEAVLLLPELELLYDYWSVRSEKEQTIHGLAKTKQTFWLEGWVPSAIALTVQEGLKDRFVVATTARAARKDENYPISFQNNRFVQSYEVIVEMFSPPSTKEIDPSPLLAPFFFITFGMMLSDLGYGILMSSLCALLLYKVKVRGEMARMSKMLLMSGIASAIWGLVFGGFFGDILTVLSGERLHFPALWFNPMDDPTQLMIFSMVFGVIHIFAGMAAKAYMHFQIGDWQSAVFDVFPWYVLLSGLGLMISGLAGSVGLYLVFFAIAVLVLFGGRQEKNPVKRLLKGIMSLYGITGYFSDVLSYTRILALVLATSVIAMVVNLLGFLLGPTPIGIVVFIIVAIGGHVLNLALSALSAYVHTSRLHFVEFFSKFYEGGGRMWRPLRVQTQYVEIDRKP